MTDKDRRRQNRANVTATRLALWVAAVLLLVTLLVGATVAMVSGSPLIAVACYCAFWLLAWLGPVGKTQIRDWPKP